jgi:hypothetical protein
LGVEGVDIGEEAAALCMNFMVRSFEDMVFGAFAGVLVADDILKGSCSNARALVR